MSLYTRFLSIFEPHYPVPAKLYRTGRFERVPNVETRYIPEPHSLEFVKDIELHCDQNGAIRIPDFDLEHEGYANGRPKAIYAIFAGDKYISTLHFDSNGKRATYADTSQ